MEKATGCSSLSVNIHQKKRVRFFLDTVGWEGGLLKLQSLPCPAGKVLPWAGGSRRCLDEPSCSFLPVSSSPLSAPSSSPQTRCLVFGLCCCSEWARDRLPVPQRSRGILRPWDTPSSSGLLVCGEEGSLFPLPASLGKRPGHAKVCKGHLGLQAVPSQTGNALM